MNYLIMGLALVFSLFSPLSSAEQKQMLGQWDVHYIVVNNSLLTPTVAKHYGLQRSAYEAFLNISVLDKTSQKAQRVSIQGHTKDLMAVSSQLHFREIIEGDAIYYLATLPVTSERHLTFTIDIQQGSHTQQLKFSQAVYPELN